VAGDLFGTFSNINPAIHKLTDLTGKTIIPPILPGQDLYPPGILIDLNDWQASARKLLAIAGSRERIIPSHEPVLCGQIFPAQPSD
jgi:glyoxylase-like metal-dependent hydrolase (beta-lactamase superfamily II)